MPAHASEGSGLASAYVFAAAFLLSMPLMLGGLYVIHDPSPRIAVGWSADVDDGRRANLETTYALVAPSHDEGTTWTYRIRDTSRANVRALVNDPSVDDTSGIDRGASRVETARTPMLLLAMVLSGLVGAVVSRPVAGRLQQRPVRAPREHAEPGPPVRGGTVLGSTPALLLSTGVFGAYYLLFLNQGLGRVGPLGTFPAEVQNHVLIARPLLEGLWQQELGTNFEPLLHALTAAVAWAIGLFVAQDDITRLTHGAVLILALSKLAQFALTTAIIERETQLPPAPVLLLALAASICTVVYLPFVSLDMYLPMSTPNMLVDPTNILLGPLALGFFYLYVTRCLDDGPPRRATTAGLALLLLAGGLAKPAFTNVFLVVVALQYLSWPRRFLTRLFVHDLAIVLPSCALLLWQLWLIQQSGAGGGLAFDPYRVIGYRTYHPAIALLQGIGFPLLVLVAAAAWPGSRRSGHLRLAWEFCLIAYLVYALFSFTGENWRAANLSWSYQIGLLLLYLFSIVEYARLASAPHLKGRLLVRACTVGLGLVCVSGLHQVVKVFLGGPYT